MLLRSAKGSSSWGPALRDAPGTLMRCTNLHRSSNLTMAEETTLIHFTEAGGMGPHVRLHTSAT